MRPRDERLTRLWAEGLPARVIAERLGLTTGTVYERLRTLRRAGHPVAPRKKEEGIGR